jgi:hypothetical protein
MTDEIESNGEATAEEKPEEAPAATTPQEAAPQSNARSPEACLQNIATAKREADEAESAYATAKKDAKEAKRSWESKVKLLRRVIGDSTDELPLFDRRAVAVPVGAPVPPGEPISTEERQRVNPTKPKRTKRSSPKRKAASRR